MTMSSYRRFFNCSAIEGRRIRKIHKEEDRTHFEASKEEDDDSELIQKVLQLFSKK
jgi:hypothetical protein